MEGQHVLLEASAGHCVLCCRNTEHFTSLACNQCNTGLGLNTKNNGSFTELNIQVSLLYLRHWDTAQSRVAKFRVWLRIYKPVYTATVGALVRKHCVTQYLFKCFMQFKTDECYDQENMKQYRACTIRSPLVWAGGTYL